jgi:hypothetical protein
MRLETKISELYKFSCVRTHSRNFSQFIYNLDDALKYSQIQNLSFFLVVTNTIYL